MALRSYLCSGGLQRMPRERSATCEGASSARSAHTSCSNFPSLTHSASLPHPLCKLIVCSSYFVFFNALRFHSATPGLLTIRDSTTPPDHRLPCRFFTFDTRLLSQNLNLDSLRRTCSSSLTSLTKFLF